MGNSDRITSGTQKRRYICWLWLLMLSAFVILLDKTPSVWAEAPPEESCMQCHGIPGMSKTLENGEKLDVHIDPAAFTASVHGKKLICSDCHTGYVTFPHPLRAIAGKKEYTLAQYEVCKNCHFANYTKTLDSIHYDLLAQGNKNAPVCTDCHSAHKVNSPSQPRSNVSTTCSTCHSPIYSEYIKSVHGSALVNGDNGDVPVCTDCHGVHDIHDPKTASFRLDSTSLCARCHTNKEMMAKYNISTQVVQTYLSDFHGITMTLRKKQSPDAWTDKAVCTDCHGIHNILRVESPDSPVVKANLVKTCQKCHPDASENFPSAWLSHYDPSTKKAPLVYIVKLFYTILIPFMLVGLSIHIGLNLWRTITHR